MSLNIKDRETHSLARALAAATGEPLAEAVKKAVQERLERVRSNRAASPRRLADRLDEIADHCASLPVRRDRSPDEMLGWDERGMPR